MGKISRNKNTTKTAHTKQSKGRGNFKTSDEILEPVKVVRVGESYSKALKMLVAHLEYDGNDIKTKRAALEHLVLVYTKENYPKLAKGIQRDLDAWEALPEIEKRKKMRIR